MWWVIAVLVLLILCSSFFSASETALTAVSKARMHTLEEEGNLYAKIVNRLLQKKERLISSLLIGNNLVNVLASTLATSLFIHYYGESRGVVYATIVMTVALIIFGEILPKSYAINRSLETSLKVSPIIRALVWGLAPIARIFEILVGCMLRLLRVAPSEARETEEKEEELRGVIAMHQGSDPGIKHERSMLKSILELADVEVAKIMTHRKDVFMLDRDMPPHEMMARVFDSPYSRIPVWRGENEDIIGVLYVKDLLKELQQHKGDITKINFETVMGSPWFIPDSTSLLSQLQSFQQRREHFAVVVDEYGSFMGIVTLEDVLEEIVGDIFDEYDMQLPSGVKPQADGSYIIDGTVPIRDLNRELNWKLPEQNATTIAGLILHETRQIPKPGQVFEYYQTQFKILKKHRNQITLIKVKPLNKLEFSQEKTYNSKI